MKNERNEGRRKGKEKGERKIGGGCVVILIWEGEERYVFML